MIDAMIDASYLESGYSTGPGEPLYAEFHDDGQLKLFRSGPAAADGRSVTLRLERGRPSGTLERLDVSREPQRDDIGESGNTPEEEFEYWVRRSIQSIYELNSFVRRCSFCEKTAEEVAVLVAGPTSYICDECIGTCQKILEENRRQAAG